MTQSIKVSVCVVAHNQDKYISQCLDSLISQEVDFPIEIIVGDDASTDSTGELIKKYAEIYPHLIKPVLNQVNLGPTKNMLNLYQQAKGEYICHVDGDDYVYQGKLQLQAQALDLNKQCIIVSHEVDSCNEVGLVLPAKIKKDHSGYRDKFYLLCNLPFFAHSSKMFRNVFGKSFYQELPEVVFDFEMHLNQIGMNQILHLPLVLGCYRRGVGVATSQGLNKELVKKKIDSLESAIKACKCAETKESLKAALATNLFYYAKQALITKEFSFFKVLIKKSAVISRISLLQVILFYSSLLHDRILSSAVDVYLFLKKPFGAYLEK